MARKRPEEWEDEEEEDEYGELALITEEIKRLVQEMRNTQMTSQEYMVLTQRLADLSEAKKNIEVARNESVQCETTERNKNAWMWQMGGTIFGNIAGQTISALWNRQNVKTVVGYENEGGIVNSKGMKFIK